MAIDNQIAPALMEQGPQRANFRCLLFAPVPSATIDVRFGRLEAEVLASEAGRSFEATSDHLTTANDFRF